MVQDTRDPRDQRRPSDHKGKGVRPEPTRLAISQLLRDQSPVQHVRRDQPGRGGSHHPKVSFPTGIDGSIRPRFERNTPSIGIHAARAAGRPCISTLPEQKLQQQRKITQHFDIDRGQP